MDIVFYFHFYAGRQDFTPSHTLAFYVANINANWNDLCKTMNFCVKEMNAQYGEHGGFTKVYDIDLLGYTSSRIDADQRDHVMHAWRAIFATHFTGCAVSDVYDVTTVLDNAKIFEHTKCLYEHQQAQQLRDTLTAHITIPASAATKKI